MAVLLGVACLPIMRFADPPTHPKGPRVSSIDGLRGFLAFAVFFHHAAISHEYWLTGKWAVPLSRFYGLLGQVGVSVFFMITAYLFWTKLLRDGGRPKWIQLYLGRVFRIGPVYWVAIAWMLLLLFWKTGFVLHEPAIVVLREIAGWLAAGIVWPRNINGYAGTLELIAGVTWSLFYEWLFYFSLVVTALVIRRKVNDLLFTASALVATVAYVLWHVRTFEARSPPAVCAELFLIGMTCASLEKRGLLRRLPNWLASGLVLLSIACIFLRYESANLAIPPLLLGAAFFLIVSGCDVFGVLTSVPARRLGDISYGVYLLQGLVLTCVLSVSPIREFFLASALQHWITVLGIAVLLVTAALVVHLLVEDPGVDLGRRLGSKIRM